MYVCMFLVKCTELNIHIFIQHVWAGKPGHDIHSCRDSFALVFRLFADLTAMSKGFWILQPFGKCIKQIIIKPKWKEYTTALAALESRLTVELLFPSSIFQKHFLAESAAALEYMRRRTTPACGLRRIGKCKHTAVWQWPLTPGPWDHTHGRGTVWVRWIFDVPFKVLKSTWSEKHKAFRSPHL